MQSVAKWRLCYCAVCTRMADTGRITAAASQYMQAELQVALANVGADMSPCSLSSPVLDWLEYGLVWEQFSK